MRRLSLAGICALVLFAALPAVTLAHFYALVELPNAPSVVVSSAAEPVETVSVWYCARPDGSRVNETAHASIAAAEVACGTLAAEAGASYRLERWDTVRAITRSTQRTVTHEVRGSAALKLTAAEAQQSNIRFGFDTRIPDSSPPPPPPPPPSIPEGWSQQVYNGTADPHTSGSTLYVQPSQQGAVPQFTALNTDGRFYFSDDSGAAWVYALDPDEDFTVPVRVDQINLASGVKAFLQVRDEDAANSAHCGVEIYPTRWAVGCRTATGGETSLPFEISGTPAAGGCLRVSGDGSIDSLLFEYSTNDGPSDDCSDATYTTLGQQFAGWASTGDTKYLAMSCASINPNRPTSCGVAFSAVAIDYSAVTHPTGQANVGFSPTSYTFDEDEGTVALTVTLTGTNAAGCTINATTVNGTAVGGTDFTAFTNTVLTWTSGQTGNRTLNLALTNRAGVQNPATRALTVSLTKATCSAPTLVNNIANVTILDDDSESPGTGLYFTRTAESRATAPGATDAIRDANTLSVEWGDPPGVDDGRAQMCWPQQSAACAWPLVYSFLTQDTANGGPTAARAGSWFLKLSRFANQPGAFFSGGVAANRVLVQNQTLGYTEFGRSEWVGFSLWVPASFNTAGITEWSFLGGIHGHSGQPTFLTFEFIHNNALNIRSRTYDGPCCAPSVGPNFWEAGPLSEPGTYHYSGAMPRGQWVDFVFNYIVDSRTSGDGMLDVWINGSQVVDYDGPLGYFDAGAPGGPHGYWYFGSYMGDNNPLNRVFYFDEIRLGGPTSSYADVDPESYD